MDSDTLIVVVATIIADLIVAVGFVGFAGIVAYFVNLRTERLLAELPDGATEEPEGAVRWLCYAGSLLFWPAGLILAILFLQKPTTARVGRVCVWMLLAYLGFSVVAAIAIVTVAALMFPALFLVG